MRLTSPADRNGTTGTEPIKNPSVPGITRLPLHTDRFLSENEHYDSNPSLRMLVTLVSQMAAKLETFTPKGDASYLSEQNRLLAKSVSLLSSCIPFILNPQSVPVSFWFKFRDLAAEIDILWSTVDQDSNFSALNESIEKLTLMIAESQTIHAREETTAAGNLSVEKVRTSTKWSQLKELVGSFLESWKSVVLEKSDDEMNEPIGKHLKIRLSGRFRYSEFMNEWPLWSEKFMADVEKLDDIKIPWKVLQGKFAQDNVDIVLVGVSGCGKSRTCYDLCRFSGQFCVFFDWIRHEDLKNFVQQLPLPPIRFRERMDSRLAFEHSVEGAIKRLIVGRLVVLRAMIESKPNLKPDNFFQIQQSSGPNGGEGFRRINDALRRVSDDEVDLRFEEILRWSIWKKVRFIMDESHVLLGFHEGLYHSSSTCEIAANGTYKKPRALLSFMARFFRDHKLRCVWAGTHLRIGDISKINSARREDLALETFVFTDFNYLTANHISQLLESWVNISNEALIRRISNSLQGRPKNFMTFIQALSQSEESVETVFKETMAKLTFEYTLFWSRVRYSRIGEFIPDLDSVTAPEQPVKSVANIMAELLYIDTFVDVRRVEHPYYYRAMVATGLVMLSEDKCEAGSPKRRRGLLCEPLVLHAARDFATTTLEPDFAANRLIERDIALQADESIRGKAVESLCVLRLREGFWKDPSWREFFPPALLAEIDAGKLIEPLGIDDCRTGVANHRQLLRASFLNPNATHVVLPQARMGGADVVYGYFSFHIKTTWTSVRDEKVHVSNPLSAASHRTIEKTYRKDPILRERVGKNPWVRFCFELPTNADLMKSKDPHIVIPDGKTTTIIAGIDSEITRQFFGANFVHLVKLITGA